ncbi:MAG: Ig-like domain-containing protein [Pseudoclavibacter sp.]
MAKRTWRKGQIAMSIILALLVAVPVTMAIMHDGFPAAEVEMESHDVWVTNAEEVLAGRLNAQINELDGSVSLASENVLVHQDGDDVFLHDRASGLLGRVDPAYTDLRESIVTPEGSASAYGDNTLAILDTETGELWAIDTQQALVFDASSKPLLELGEGAQVVVTGDGTILASSPGDGSIYRITELGAEPVKSEIGDLDDYELTAVGEKAAVLDRTNNLVRFEGGEKVALDEVGVRIQQPGAEAGFVLVATSTGVDRVEFSGDVIPLEPRVVGGGVEPSAIARPVNLDGCSFGAWAAPKTLTTLCEGQEPVAHDIEQSIEGEVTFRVNRNVIVLNDLKNGNVWLPQDHMRYVENWQDTVPPEDEEGTDGDNEATEESFEDTLAERTEENHPPELNDDVFGVRPGSTAYMPVLDNDSDPDGDIITVVDIKGEVPSSVGTLSVIDEGRGLQFSAEPGASGEYTVTYIGSDGREGGVAEANLTIQIVPGTVENRPPESRHESTVSVEAGQTLAYNVLGDWIDPDGDPVYLLSASAPGGMAVAAAPDGTLTVTAIGAELGKRIVSYVVSDGTSTAMGELTVDVAQPGSLSPVGTPDYARGPAGTTITSSPLVNDLSPSGAPLSIVEITELGDSGGGATFNPDLGTVSYKSSTPGTYYVQYTMTSGTHDSVGLVRFDVLDPEEVSNEITAVRDVGYLRPGVPTTIEVLNNDMSMSSDVLSVQELIPSDEARAAGVAIELLDNTDVRVTSQAALLEPIEIIYRITDGEQTAEGVVVLVPVEPIVNRQPPMAVDDSRRVRAGDFTSVDVLANDIHPDDVAMKVMPQLSDANIGDGVAFVTNNQVRFQAPNEPGTYQVSYVATDEYGEQGGATVTFTVVADDEASNRPPAPPTQTARVFEGASVLVNVPVTGVDPDGDSVTFNGVVGSPSLGSIRETNQTSFIYEAFPGASGTDTIRYEIVDTYGQRAEGVIKIGVVPRGDQTQPPVAVDDPVYARPGTTISVPVLVNDSDPNGYTVDIVDDLTEVDPALEAEIDGEAIVLTMPADGDFISVPYSITNGQGGTSTAWINITLTDEAPDQPPSAVDQIVPNDAFEAAPTFDVDPRSGAHNPAGRVADLSVALAGVNAGSAEVLPDGLIRVTPTDRRQVIAYTLTNGETGLEAAAFIMVPAVVTEESKRQSPFLDPDLEPQNTRVETPITWNVNDLVTAPSGNPVKIIESGEAWAEQSDGSPIVVDESTITYAPKPGFRGPASVTFMVSDATGPDDTNAGIATIRVPLTVGDPEFRDVAPTFVTPQVSVEVGTTATYDLRDATGHPNPDLIGEVTFSNLSGGAEGVSISLDGSTLSATAALDTPVSTVATLDVTYTLGEFVQTGTIKVTVVSSSLPLPRTTDDEHASLRGETVTVDVASNDYNPYPEAPLRVIEATEQSSENTGAKVEVVGNQVRIEPSASFIGTITVRYKIGDGTMDKTREAYGYATLRVRDVPSAPASVSLERAGAGKLKGSWELAQSNGEPIEGYEAVLEPTGTGRDTVVVQLGTATSYTFTRSDGVVPGVSYTLKVRAQNMLGWGNLSAPSSSETPIDQPSAPQGVALSSAYTEKGEGKGQLVVSWNPPAETGGEITQYIVKIKTPAEEAREIPVGAEARSYTLTGLTVNTHPGSSKEYGVTVTAVNSEGQSTSNVATGHLTYQPDPKVEFSKGGLRAVDDDNTYWYAFHFDGEDFLPDETYEIKCEYHKEGFLGIGNTWVDLGTDAAKGAEFNDEEYGVEPAPNCQAPDGTKIRAEISLNGEVLFRFEERMK